MKETAPAAKKEDSASKQNAATPTATPSKETQAPAAKDMQAAPKKDAQAATGGTPSKDQQACLQAVSIKTNNGDVVVLSTETSEANNVVVVGVGPQRAPWRCLVSRGVVAEVSSQTDEGRL